MYTDSRIPLSITIQDFFFPGGTCWNWVPEPLWKQDELQALSMHPPSSMATNHHDCPTCTPVV